MPMKAFFLAILVRAAKAYFGSGLFLRVQTYVDAMADMENVSGEQKKRLVLSAIKKEAGEVENSTINAMIEIAVQAASRGRSQ